MSKLSGKAQVYIVAVGDRTTLSRLLQLIEKLSKGGGIFWLQGYNEIVVI